MCGQHNGLKSAGLPNKNSHDASLALRDATAEDGVQALGNPYRRFTWSNPAEGSASRHGDDPLEIASAVCRDDHGSPDCLVPKDMHEQGKGFQSVFFRRSSVLGRFPPLQATRATAKNEDKE